ncbi:MAG: transglycosylase SLT domain-containing protein [Patescibacteria group bacterium]|nr:transglycosylase SLT domain-containing protein [Patescibacteria group bacterium]
MFEDHGEMLPIKNPPNFSTRRSFLKKVAAAAIGVAAGELGVKISAARTRKEENISKTAFLSEKPVSLPTPKPTSIPVLAQIKEPQKKPKVFTQAPTPTETVSVSGPTFESYQDLIFPDYTRWQKDEADKMVTKQIEYYQSEPEKDERILRTLSWVKDIHEISDSLGLNRSFPQKIIDALIYVESGGDPTAETDVAEGLCQLSYKAVESLRKLPDAQKYFEEKKTVNLLKDPKENIRLALGYLKRLLDIYPEPSVALWAYHLGDENMNFAIETYCKKDLGMDQEFVDDTLSYFDFKTNQTGTAKLIAMNRNKTGRINFINLVRSTHVVDALKARKAFGNKTNLYVPRIAAAHFLMEEYVKRHVADNTLPKNLKN